MDPFSTNPFTVFTLITAPAVLTNASAVMSLTTSNRLARAMDRARQLQAELSHTQPPTDRAYAVRRLELTRRRALVMTQALGAFQLAYGSFAAATLVALIGAALASFGLFPLAHGALAGSFACFMTAIVSTMVGAIRLVRETRLAYEVVREDTARLLAELDEAARR
ncbi:MAG: DUF2721 domain-containing protein [Gemmataceae bacterium]